MKKFLSICVIVLCMMMIGMPITKADAYDTFKIELTVTDNAEQKDFELYMLLPEEYIYYAINNAGLDINYTGAETLKQNQIPGINIDASRVQDETYDENGIEYVQILLEPEEENTYTFEILSSYTYMDMKFRIRNDEKDYIMHLNNFKIQEDTCKIEYSYDNNEIKQNDRIIINFGAILLIIVLAFIVIIAVIAKIKTRK